MLGSVGSMATGAAARLRDPRLGIFVVSIGLGNGRMASLRRSSCRSHHARASPDNSAGFSSPCVVSTIRSWRYLAWMLAWLDFGRALDGRTTGSNAAFISSKMTLAWGQSQVRARIRRNLEARTFRTSPDLTIWKRLRIVWV